MIESPYLSIIIPAFNEEKRLPGTLEKIRNFLLSTAFQTEVIVVENGSSDQTAEVVREFIGSRTDPDELEKITYKLLQEKEAGKGLAVNRGLRNA